MTSKTTCFRGVDWLVGWDRENDRHCYFRNADFAFSGGEVLFAGPGKFEAEADAELDGRDLCIFPGLVNIHVHSASMPTFRGIREDTGNPNFYFSGVYEGWGLFVPPHEARTATTKLAICEMLLSGVTSYVDMSYPYPGWLETVASSGIRAVISPLFESGRVVPVSDHQLEYRWSDDLGEAAFEQVVRLLDEVGACDNERVTGMVSPMTLDTCSPELLKRAYQLSLDRRLPFHIHAGMSVIEFLEMVRRTGMTSVQWLKHQGLLGPTTIVGHGAVLDHHSWVHWHTSNDLDILATSGASVSHCPVVLGRYGMTLESFGKYRKAGVNVGIGTDCHPHNMIEEMREAAVLSRVAEQHMFSAATSDVFDAATVGGAKAIGIPDIGRLSSGAKADFVVAEASHPMMLPMYDPLRSLIYSAADRAIRDVYVGGDQVVANRNVLTIDHQAVAEMVSKIQEDVVSDIPNRDRKGRTAAQVAPKAYEEV